MSAFLSPLWLLGISNSNPNVSLEADNMLNGIVGPSMALPTLMNALLPQVARFVTTASPGAKIGLSVLVSASLPGVAQDAKTGNACIRLALPFVLGGNGSVNALPVIGVTHG